jgi:hypothetical protein
MTSETVSVRMPTLPDIAPAALELAYLVDVAGGLELAARLTNTTPAELVDWLTGTPTAGLALATRRLASVLAARVGWSARPVEVSQLRAVA